MKKKKQKKHNEVIICRNCLGSGRNAYIKQNIWEGCMHCNFTGHITTTAGDGEDNYLDQLL